MFAVPAVVAVMPALSTAQVYFDPYVSANARVQASFSGPTDRPLVTRTSDSGYQFFSSGATSALADLSLDESRTDAFAGTYHIRNSASFLATAGVLHASASSLAELTQTLISTAVHSQAGGWTLASTNPGASFLDTITIGGPGVGYAVPITVNASLDGTSSISAADGGTQNSWMAATGTLSVNSTSDGSGTTITQTETSGHSSSFDQFQSFTTWVVLGTPFQLYGNLSISADAGRAVQLGSDSSSFVASHTGKVTIDLPTGYTLRSASGFNYQPTPEPASICVLAMFALGLVTRKRRS